MRTLSLLFVAACVACGSSVDGAIATPQGHDGDTDVSAIADTDGAPPGENAPGDTSPAPPTTGDETIKWHPGHYMASITVFRPGATIDTIKANVPYEFTELANDENIVGYRVIITWAAIEKKKDTYDLQLVRDLLAYVRSIDKYLVLVVEPGSFTSTSAVGSREVPAYILADSQYGPSPVSGSYGWWGGTGNGNTSAACLHRPKVMDRWVKLHQYLGEQLDGDPNLEAIMFQEGSWIVGASTTNGVPDFNNATNTQNYENMLTATVAAFPHTNVIFENTWLVGETNTQQFEQFMLEHRVAPGTADTYGQTYVDKRGGKLNSWGLNAYIGLTDPTKVESPSSYSTYTGPDYRELMPSMVDIEGPDLGAYTGCHTSPTCQYSPADICTALNRSYHASHAFWTNLGKSNTHYDSGTKTTVTDYPERATWPNVLNAIADCPIAATEYPPAYH